MNTENQPRSSLKYYTSSNTHTHTHTHTHSSLSSIPPSRNAMSSLATRQRLKPWPAILMSCRYKGHGLAVIMTAVSCMVKNRQEPGIYSLVIHAYEVSSIPTRSKLSSNCRRFDYSAVVFFRAYQGLRDETYLIMHRRGLIERWLRFSAFCPALSLAPVGPKD